MDLDAMSDRELVGLRNEVDNRLLGRATARMEGVAAAVSGVEPYPSPAPMTYANLGKACEAQPGLNDRSGRAIEALNPGRPWGNSEVTLETIDEVMRYQPWGRHQQDCGDQVREALTAAAKTILRVCPAGRFRSVAVRNILDARMNANAAISFRGRF